MSKALILNEKFENAGDVVLPAKYAEINSHNLYLYVKSYLASLRANTARAKGRSEVSGGGKKPKAQKGSGGARWGSLRSPLFVGGGQAFGPQKRNYVQKINKKQKALALSFALNAQGQNGSLFTADSIKVESGKTKDAVAVMESIQRVSAQKMAKVNSQVTRDDVIKDLVNCGYVKSADLADRFGDPSTLNPLLDVDIVGPGGIFSLAEFDSENEFQKTASVMKLVVNGFSGAGTITMGGFDYHTGERATGELRDLRAGRCMGACLEYAARKNQPLMMYVFSDGSVASNGRIDDSEEGRGKSEWTGDNSSTGASFFLVYNPNGKPQLMGATAEQNAIQQQIGFMRPDASVETASAPSAGNVNLLVETVLLNYMALHGEQGQFSTLVPSQGLGNSTMLDSLTAFQPIITG